MSASSIVRKAVIPAAGLGTRLFPASHAVKKELFPIVGADGIARALFHYHLIELAAAGIEEICILVQPGEDALFRSYLQGPGDDYLRRLEKYPALLREAEQMRGFAERIRFAVQREQEGYGHAVFQSRDFANGEMVLLCLGDHLFRGKPVSPYAELAGMAAVSNGRSVSAVNRISADELKGYGTIAGARRAENPRLIDVSLIIEKPSPTVARQRLHVDGLPDETWLGWFGMHLLAPSIYDVLEEMIRDNIRDNGEFQLTRAQEIQRQREGCLALEITAGERFDFGTPEDFAKSVATFRLHFEAAHSSKQRDERVMYTRMKRMLMVHVGISTEMQEVNKLLQHVRGEKLTEAQTEELCMKMLERTQAIGAHQKNIIEVIKEIAESLE